MGLELNLEWQDSKLLLSEGGPSWGLSFLWSHLQRLQQFNNQQRYLLFSKLKAVLPLLLCSGSRQMTPNPLTQTRTSNAMKDKHVSAWHQPPLRRESPHHQSDHRGPLAPRLSRQLLLNITRQTTERTQTKSTGNSNCEQNSVPPTPHKPVLSSHAETSCSGRSFCSSVCSC